MCSDLSNNAITELKSDAFEGLSKLTAVDVSSNSIAIIEAGTFSDLPLLTTVDVSSNSIAIIEAGAFSDLPLLTTVDVSSNSIVTIEAGAFSDLPLLTTLTLSSSLMSRSSIYNYAQMDGIKELCKTAHAAKTLFNDGFSANPVCANQGGAIGGAVGGGLFLIAFIAISICVVRKKRALKGGLAAANYNRAPPTSNTPIPYGAARPTTATAASYTNAAFMTAGAGPVYEEIADGVPVNAAYMRNQDFNDHTYDAVDDNGTYEEVDDVDAYEEMDANV